MRRYIISAALIIVAGVVTALLFNAPGTNDIHIWERWIGSIQQHGLIAGYGATWTDYPPGAFVILSIVNVLAQFVGVFAAIKLSLLVFLIATALIVYAWSRRPWLALAVYFVLLLNALGLAYLDVYTAPFLIAALWMLSLRRWSAFAALYFCACTVKWQPLIVAPVFALYIWRQIGWRRAIRAIGPEIIAVVVIGLTFGLPVVGSLYNALHHDTWSGNAFNLGWIASQVGAPAWYPLLAKALFASAYGALLIAFVRRKRTYAEMLRFALVAFLTYFTLNIGVHENHLYTVLLLAIALYIIEPDMTLAVIAILHIGNSVIFYGFNGQQRYGSATIYLTLAALYVCAWALYYAPLIRNTCDLSQAADGSRTAARAIFDALTLV